LATTEIAKALAIVPRHAPPATTRRASRALIAATATMLSAPLEIRTLIPAVVSVFEALELARSIHTKTNTVIARRRITHAGKATSAAIERVRSRIDALPIAQAQSRRASAFAALSLASAMATSKTI
jgi:hypothetical protein